MSQFKLLTVGNPKIEKGAAFGYLTAVLHLAPGNLSGFQVCPMATQGCLAACLNTAGRGGIMEGHSRLTLADLQAGTQNTIQKARIRRTRWYFENRDTFMVALAKDIAALVRMATRHGLKPAIRLNGTSDIPWERVGVPLQAGGSLHWSNLMQAFPHVQFYDYTKRPNRKGLPANYSLCFSLAEGNDTDAAIALCNGMNVAAVFHKVPEIYSLSNIKWHKLPSEFPLAHRVINGDEHDLRFLDPKGCIVGLKAKGNAKRDTSGFVR